MAEYRDVSWGDDEDIRSAKLNRMSQSIRYLKEQQVPIQYKAFTGVNKSEGLRIACGILHVPPAPGPYIIANVHFGTYFTVGCNPVVLNTLMIRDQRHVTLTMQGIGVGNSRPDHTGFTNVIQAIKDGQQNPFPLAMTIHWMAIGW